MTLVVEEAAVEEAPTPAPAPPPAAASAPPGDLGATGYIAVSSGGEMLRAIAACAGEIDAPPLTNEGGGGESSRA